MLFQSAIFQISLFSNILLTITDAIKCDFNRFPSGCEDEIGSVCNMTSNQCQCKDGFDVRVSDLLCLQLKNITESCFISAQCIQLPRAKIGCYYDDQELVKITSKSLFRIQAMAHDLHLIKGACYCAPGYYLNSNNECVSKKLLDSFCISSNECLTTNSYCDYFTQKCRCKPKFRYSSKRNKCVSQLIGESCLSDEHCQVYDSNAECKIGGCQCKSSYIINSSGKCVQIITRGASHNVLMVIVIIGTALVFALLSTIHKKWTASEMFAQYDSDHHQAATRTISSCRTHHSHQHLSPAALSVPALAVIWPLQRPMFLPNDQPPSYAEATGQTDNNNNINNNRNGNGNNESSRIAIPTSEPAQNQ